MNQKAQKIFTALTPPIVAEAGKLVYRRFKRTGISGFKFGVEQPPEFYDQTFELNSDYRKHYTESSYYPVWTVIADRIRGEKDISVIDIGCGSGQFGSFMRDFGVSRYTGIDFSKSRIAYAKSICPEFHFYDLDVFQEEILDQFDYDLVVVLEFLEHVENDIGVLTNLKRGTKVLASVPNFPAQGHVRLFHSESEVLTRYCNVFERLEVDKIIANSTGKAFFIIEGITK